MRRGDLGDSIGDVIVESGQSSGTLIPRVFGADDALYIARLLDLEEFGGSDNVAKQGWRMPSKQGPVPLKSDQVK